MLVIRIELWPGGDARRLRSIELLTIVNVGWLDDERCRYEVRLGEDLARVKHRRSDGAVALTARALSAVARRQAARKLLLEAHPASYPEADPRPTG